MDIPAAAWIAPSAIPLYAAYHWSSPSAAARSAKAPELSAVRDCHATLSSADRSELGAFPAERADLSPTTGASGGRDGWAVQETILATDDTSSGDVQGIYDLYTDLVADLARCADTASGAKVSVAVDKGSEYAATITVPTSTVTTSTNQISTGSASAGRTVTSRTAIKRTSIDPISTIPTATNRTAIDRTSTIRNATNRTATVPTSTRACIGFRSWWVLVERSGGAW